MYSNKNRTSSQRARITAAIAIASLLIALMAVVGLPRDVYAARTTFSAEVANDDTITIKKVLISVTKERLSKGTATVSIVQDDEVIEKEKIRVKKSRATDVTLRKYFDDVQVTGDFDILISYSGRGAFTVNSIEFNGQTITPSSNDGNNDGGNDNGNGEQNPPPPPPPPPAPVTSTLIVEAKNVDDLSEEVAGMWIAVLQESILVDSGHTEKSFELTNGESYSVYMDDYSDGTTTWDFVGWQGNSQGKFRSFTMAGDDTFTALYRIDPPTGTSENGGDTGGDNNGNTGDDGTNPGTPGMINVDSELLDGTAAPGYMVRYRMGGTNVESQFTPASFAPGHGDRIVMYWAGDCFFRHFTDGTLLRYHLVDGPEDLVARYECVPPAEQATLNIVAQTTSGQQIGGTTGMEDDGSLSADPGVYLALAPPGTLTPYTAAFSGSSSLPFTIFKDQTYVVSANSFGQYQFSHWEDNGSTNAARAVNMDSDKELVAIYNVVP